MIVIFEFTTLQGFKYPCNLTANNVKEAKEKLKKMYNDLQIEFICFKYVDEWECLIGLS